MLKSIGLLFAFVCCVACSSKSSPLSDNAPTSDAAATTDAAATVTGDAEAPGVTLTSDSYTLQPGDEKYYCYTMNLPDDEVITAFVPDYGPVTHHIFFAYTLAPEPNGFSVCDVLIKTTWIPMFLGGRETSSLSMPAGAGVKLKKGQQVLLQLHLLNATASAATGTTGIRMVTAADPNAPIIPAGIWGMNDETISIPPHMQGYEEKMSCSADIDLNVFAVLGHEHKLGTHINVQHNGTTLYDAPWNFNMQPTSPLVTTIKKGDKLQLTCTYDNTTDSVVNWGESTYNEMCAFVFYYTNYQGLDGCENSGLTADGGAVDGGAAGEGGMFP